MFKLQNGYINPKYIVRLEHNTADPIKETPDKYYVWVSYGDFLPLTKEEYEELTKL